MGDAKAFALKVLDFWHKVEFFESADLKDIAVGQKGVIHYQTEDLINDPSCLPWINREQIRKAGTGFYPDKNYSFKLFFGLFQRCEIFEQAKKYESEQNNVVWEERINEKGTTCSATIQVDANGNIQIDTLALSTVPWALGQLVKGGLNAVKFEKFEESVEKLKAQWIAVDKVAGNIKEELGSSKVLTVYELIAYLKLLGEWAGFTPTKSSPTLIVQLFPKIRKKDDAFPSIEPLDKQAVKRLESLEQELVGFEKAQAKADAKEKSHKKQGNSREVRVSSEDLPKVDILNSFYIRDIEQTIQCINKHGLAPDSPLGRYLAPSYSRHADLLTRKGERLIAQQLKIAKTPTGRWPDKDIHTMSLMQQFALNSIAQDLKRTGLFSVNGPPGTGKTTMLRDLVAENIVSRAAVLAKLPKASDAFSRKSLTVKINGKEVKGIKQLLPELTGFEMVVLSSNNTAVENITKELPQTKALGENYQELTYLKPVAQKLAAKHVSDKKGPTKIYGLEPEKNCWGLIATALGNSSNRKKFTDRVVFNTIDKLDVMNPVAQDYRTLVAAIKELAKDKDVASEFSSAQKEYKKAVENFDKAKKELEHLENLLVREDEILTLREQVSNEEHRLSHTKACLAKLERRKLPWWTFEVRRYCYQSAVIKAFKLKTQEKQALLIRRQGKLNRAEQNYKKEQLECEPLKQKYSGARFYQKSVNLNDKKYQRKALGHCEELNQLRATIAAKAFELHQAWLVACYEGCFSKTVNQFSQLLSGGVVKDSHALVMWQCFFMVVPVVSSTFASVASQFSQLKHGDIGWLFIDEAGQASPQVAIGGLFRAKRAVVVGDPLQIEPVFTIPPPFVDSYAQKLLGKGWRTWTPTSTSVQRLADRVNPYGTNLISEEYWLGSPLRVHRRCSDPMFSISNQIAYNETMIHGIDDIKELEPFVWNTSCWFDISGEVEGKHFVPEQAVFVLEMLNQYVEEHRCLPDLYIISPFRKVKAGVKKYLEEHFSHQAISSTEFELWIKGRVGTVHTFQGKEQDYVILVLGLEKGTPGAALWASEKPNLLNVAATRAKKRFYVVGCKQLWGGQNYFGQANAELKILQQAVSP